MGIVWTLYIYVIEQTYPEPTPMSDQNARLDTIEIKLAHLERALQELGATVMRQQREYEALMARQRLMQQQIQMLESGAGGESGFEKPPHY